MKNNFWNKVLVSLFVLMLVLIGFKFFQKSSLEEDLRVLKQGISELTDSLTNYQKSDFEATVLAKQVDVYLKDQKLPWSTVLSKISDTIPEDKSGNKLLNVLSYSGSFGNEISLNVSTTGNSDSPYSDVAKFISAFNQSNYFVDSFVPSIAFGLNTEGKEILTFSFQTKFQEVLEFAEERVPVLR